MFDMQVWQFAVFAIVAIVSLAWMSRAILRLTPVSYTHLRAHET